MSSKELDRLAVVRQVLKGRRWVCGWRRWPKRCSGNPTSPSFTGPIVAEPARGRAMHWPRTGSPCWKSLRIALVASSVVRMQPSVAYSTPLLPARSVEEPTRLSWSIRGRCGRSIAASAL
jgi:hypothetical protein